MKLRIGWLLFVLLLAGCNSPSSQVVDNGKPGNIEILVFEDGNGNEIQDAGEVGISEEVSITQQISCPGTDTAQLTRLMTDAQGRGLFTDLKPGVYCVAYMGGESTTTRITIKVPVSSEQTTQVTFGVMPE